MAAVTTSGLEGIVFGLACELRPGDTLVTFQTEWTVRRSERHNDGVSLYFKEFPFPWRYGWNEFVWFRQGAEAVA